MNKHLILIIALPIILFACSDNTNSEPSSPNKSSLSKVTIKNSKLLDLINKENVCELLITKTQIKKMFNSKSDININGSKYKGTAYCDYSWDKADKADRQVKYASYLVNSVGGTLQKSVPMRLRTLQSSFRITVSQSNTQPQYFIPEQKSEEEIKILVERAKKSANNALSQEQKDLAGDAAGDMIESLIRKSNLNTTIDNLGDAAYWSNLMDGTLNILDGNAAIEISIIKIGDTMQADKQNAVKLARELLQ